MTGPKRLHDPGVPVARLVEQLLDWGRTAAALRARHLGQPRARQLRRQSCLHARREGVAAEEDLTPSL
jgi:hypothetical protein